MENSNLNKYINNIGFLFLFLIVTGSILIIINGFIIFMGSDIQDLNIAYSLEKNIKNNNLSLPLPNVDNYLYFGKFDKSSGLFMNEFNKPINEFIITLNNSYIYTLNEYDCKYWSYVWTLYWKQNYKKYNWDLKYITTTNHVFVMVSNETGYIIMDENTIDCRGLGMCQ